MKNHYNDKLISLMDEFAHYVYQITRKFPKEELYGITSQLRRASLSVVLNFIEGYSRKKKLVMINFYEISYGSLKETKYLINFSFKEKLINKIEFQKSIVLAEEISKMLWTSINNLNKN